MRVLNEARVALYRALSRRLPLEVRDWLAASSLTLPFRRALFWRHAETAVDFEGHHFTITAPVKVISTIRRDGGIENRLCRLILQQCGPGAVALDVGANYGFVSMVMAKAVGGEGLVHSFEADPEIARTLAANIRTNGLQQRCTVVHGFVGNVANGADRVTLDAYAAAAGLARVDFLKIDVDGPDFEVLDGARELLARFHPVIAIEMTGEQQRIVALLEELGYQCTDMQGRDLDPTAWPPNVLAAVGRRLQVPPRR